MVSFYKCRRIWEVMLEIFSVSHHYVFDLTSGEPEQAMSYGGVCSVVHF